MQATALHLGRLATIRFPNRVRLHPAHSEIHPIFPYNLCAAICRGIDDRRSTRVPEHQNRSAYTCGHGLCQDCGDGIQPGCRLGD